MGLFWGSTRDYLGNTYKLPNGLPWLGCLVTLQVKGYLGGHLWAYRLFKDYIGSYLSKFDLDERVPSVLHKGY